MKPNSKDYVLVLVPKKHWATIVETLSLDAESRMFDEGLKKDIRKALDSTKEQGVTIKGIESVIGSLRYHYPEVYPVRFVADKLEALLP